MSLRRRVRNSSRWQERENSWGSQSWLPPALSRRWAVKTRTPSRLERRLQARLPAPQALTPGRLRPHDTLILLRHRRQPSEIKFLHALPTVGFSGKDITLRVGGDT